MQNQELRRWISGVRMTLLTGAALMGALALSTPTYAADALVRLTGHVPAITSASTLLGHVTQTQPMSLEIALAARDPKGLKDLIRRQSDPNDALYGHYLTSAEFAERFGATQKNYDAVVAFAKSHGLTVTGTHENRLIVDVSGKPSDIEAAFSLHLNTYQKADGATYVAPDADPALPASIAANVQGVVGLSSAASIQSLTAPVKPMVSAESAVSATPTSAVGLGPSGFLAPADIQSVYALADGVFNGAGQTVAFLELGGFYPSDVTQYETYFNLPKPQIQVIPVLGYNGTPGPDYAQATLDIDAVLASAPGVSSIRVYEAPICDGSVAGVSPGWIAALAEIAIDDKASQVGISYGAPESAWIQTDGIGFLAIQDLIFQEMAVQGQTVYAASGDNGAYADGQTLSVDSPASDPYVAAVGGTSLTTAPDSANPAILFYAFDTTWNALATGGGASGGGVSSVFSIPSWQTPYVTTINQASAKMRNLPDVASVADPNTGLAIYLGKGPSGAGFYGYGGTGLASSLWVGLNAKVNEVRAEIGNGPDGLVGPLLYGIYGTGPGAYASGIGAFDFIDVADGSTNGDTTLFPGLPGYATGTGYDLANGLGSYIGQNIFPDLAGYSSYYTAGKNMPPANPANFQALPGNGYVNLSWSAVPGAEAYLLYRFPTGQLYFTPIAVVHGLSYTDSGLIDGVQPDGVFGYEYYVTAVGPGGESDILTAPVVTAIPNPLFPVFPTVVTATGGKATVTWTTDVLANATVVYATNAALTTGRTTITNKAFALNQQVTLSGLKPGTVYYLDVSDNDGLTSVTSPVVSFTAQ